MKKYILLILLFALSFIVACSDDGDSDINADGDTETESEDVEGDITLPTLSTKCSNCHDYDELQVKPADADMGVKQWTASKGRGFVTAEAPIPEAGKHYLYDWPERGYHSEYNMNDCSGCHPVDENGIGHMVITYPAAALKNVFKSDASCAASCHDWIPSKLTVQGFEDKDGNAPSYDGSLRPYDLLTAHNTKHTELYKNGLRTEREDIGLGAFNPGCGGCHHIKKEAHGEIVHCSHCHKFENTTSKLHKSHIATIEANMADRDPASDGITACNYCHFEDDKWAERSRAACYNCHLSAHQPLNTNGKPHFWK